jgi:pantoate kinase
MAPRNPQHRGNPTRAERSSAAHVRVERVDNAGTLLDVSGEPLARQTTWRVVIDGVEVADVNTRAEARALARLEREPRPTRAEICAEEVNRHGFCRHCEVAS